MIPDKLLRMKEVSTLLGVTPQTLRNWSNEGYIQAVIGKGGQRRFAGFAQMNNLRILHANLYNAPSTELFEEVHLRLMGIRIC